MAKRPLSRLCSGPPHGWLALLPSLLAALVSSCSWEPLARSAQPERILEGPVRVDRTLDYQGERVLLSSGSVPERFRIYTSKQKSACDLPAGGVPVGAPLLAPKLSSADDPAFLLPVLIPRPVSGGEEADEDAPVIKQIYFSDEHCRLAGPYGDVYNAPLPFTLRDDERQVALATDPEGTLSLVDPWRAETRVIARSVSTWVPVDAMPSAKGEPQALWLLEDGKLTMRALDGTLLLTRGEDVSELHQRTFGDGIRIAYRDGKALFEARSPEFAPVLIADDACRADYSSEGLDFFMPCEQDPEQLVRIELSTGRVRRFTPGVYRSFPQGAVTVELSLPRRTAAVELWLVSSTGERVRIVPTPSHTNVTAIGTTRYAGRTSGRQFGVWDVTSGFTPLLSGVEEVIPYHDSRTSQPLWLVRHDVTGGLGKLSTFTQRDVQDALANQSPLALDTLAEAVPGYAVGFQVIFASIVSEPVVLTVEQAVKHDNSYFAGTLYARLMNGDLPSRIDDDVSSAALVSTPLPGILYGVREGPNSGLWFAAL